MDKWEKLKQYVREQRLIAQKKREFNRESVLKEILTFIEDLDAVEITEGTHGHRKEPPKEVFYYSGIPDFDKKTWERMLEERGIPGLA